MMKALLKKFTLTLKLLLFLVLLEVIILFLLPHRTYSIEGHVGKVLKECSTAAHKPSCYEREIPKLLNTLSMEQSFDVIRMVRIKDTSYTYCHVTAHKVGEREVQKDPDNWINVIPRCPGDGLCSNGCLHGAMMARFRNDTLTDSQIERAIPDLQRACEPRDSWKPTNLDQAICYHGLGHLIVHVTGADMSKSLEICKRIEIRGDSTHYLRLCREGVFMQIFQPLEPEDFALIEKLEMKPNRGNLGEVCNHYGRTIEEKEACWREGWALHRDYLLRTNTFSAQVIVDFCSSRADETYEATCYSAVLYGTARLFLESPARLLTLCSEMPFERSEECYGIGAATFIEEDKNLIDDAVKFCSKAQPIHAVEGCYDYLLNVAGFIFHQNSSEYTLLCNALPKPWNERCISAM